MSEARAITNLFGNAVATLVVPGGAQKSGSTPM